VKLFGFLQIIFEIHGPEKGTFLFCAEFILYDILRHYMMIYDIIRYDIIQYDMINNYVFPQLLLSHSNTDANLMGGQGNTPLMLACSVDNHEAVRLLVCEY
jgi:ankyrin repeat protein